MKTTKRIQFIVIGAVAVCMAGSRSVRAQEDGPLGTAFTYQGRLASSGKPLSNTADFQFTLWDDASAGNQIGALVPVNNVNVVAGLFTVPLNANNEFGVSAFNGEARWLQIALRSPAGGGAFTTLGPRQALTATPNALFALNADRLDGLDSTAFLQSIPVPLTLSGTSAHIIRGDNTSTTNGVTAVFGSATAAATVNYGVFGQSDSAQGRGVAGVARAASGGAYGGQFQSDSTGGRGVYASATAATGDTYGVYGRSASTSGIGVYGSATAGSGVNYGGWFHSDSTNGYGVYGLAAAASGVNYGGWFQSDSTTGRGVLGLATAASGSTYGGRFQSDSTSGRGVFGEASAATGTTYGVYGHCASTDGLGVYGEATAVSGPNIGVYGRSASTLGRAVFGLAAATSGANYGVFGQSASTTGLGVLGTATAVSGANYGVAGQSASSSGIGVFGSAYAASGTTFGGRFESDSTSGRGIFGEATAATGITYGGRFENGSIDGTAVYGYASKGERSVGVYARSNGGQAAVIGLNDGAGAEWGGDFETDGFGGRGLQGTNLAATGPNYGVYGAASSQNRSAYAVYAGGDFGASGAKSFRIDHPDDPENKYLLHYSVESPEVINFYRGTVTLDGAGEVVVELPSYFAKVNKDPSYVLTAVGAPMPMLHVALEISADALAEGANAGPDDLAPPCSFRIAGGAPGARVSWEVKAVRNDRWVQQRGAPVEVDKQDPERGKYQHPELYGQPPEMGMDYRPDTDRAAPERPSPAALPEATPR